MEEGGHLCTGGEGEGSQGEALVSYTVNTLVFLNRVATFLKTEFSLFHNWKCSCIYCKCSSFVAVFYSF